MLAWSAKFLTYFFRLWSHGAEIVLSSYFNAHDLFICLFHFAFWSLFTCLFIYYIHFKITGDPC